MTEKLRLNLTARNRYDAIDQAQTRAAVWFDINPNLVAVEILYADADTDTSYRAHVDAYVGEENTDV